MSLQVTERQQVEQWYELSGYIKACEVFPKLLPNSESVAEVEDDIESEHEFNEGRYDGCPQGPEAMQDEFDKFTKSALSEFHDEALTAAKDLLMALKATETLLHKDFEDKEEEILEEAAKALGIALPWDPAEAAQIAAAQIAQHARTIVYAQNDVARAQAMLDQNEAEITRAKAQNKPKMVAHGEGLRGIRIRQLEEARRKLESLVAETDSENTSGAGSPAMHTDAA
jgi:hypothetical protein